MQLPSSLSHIPVPRAYHERRWRACAFIQLMLSSNYRYPKPAYLLKLTCHQLFSKSWQARKVKSSFPDHTPDRSVDIIQWLSITIAKALIIHHFVLYLSHRRYLFIFPNLLIHPPVYLSSCPYTISLLDLHLVSKNLLPKYPRWLPATTSAL